MANTSIPVPTDLKILRVGIDKLELHFTSTRDDLLYQVRADTAANSIDNDGLPGAFWMLNAYQFIDIGPYPRGTVVVLPVDLNGPDVPKDFLIPPPGFSPLHAKIVAIDPVTRDVSLFYPPGPDDPTNWGQGPGVVMQWADWVEPVVPPPVVLPPPPPPVEPEAPAPEPERPTAVTKAGQRFEYVQIGPAWKLPWGVFRILLGKDIP